MDSQFNGEMVQLARDLRGWSQAELAHTAGLTQGYISQIEHGEKLATDERIGALAAALKFPREFFHLPERNLGLGVSVLFYRKRAGTQVADLRRLQAQANLRAIILGRLLHDVQFRCPYSIQALDIDDFGGGAAEMAALTRASWHMPLGPVSNLMGVIERAGGIVFKFPFGTRDIDAMSRWADNLPPLFFVNAESPAERIRFSLAHELGHVIMHRRASETIEEEANEFAAEFLMPSKDVYPDLAEMSVRKAASLKGYWRVSMAALVKRARDVGRIDQATYQRLFRALSAMGYRKKEPFPIPHEEPTALPKLLNALDAGGLSLADQARRSCIYADVFRACMVMGKDSLRLVC
jgi:Zn-dependent peptidase ImmA (M78 family)/transcriptional regulator with XRE-family HTH domain